MAAATNLSVAAVSFALNGTGGVSEQTRQRVREAAEDLGYHPNSSARGLATGETGLLAILASVDPSFASFLEVDYIAEVIRGASAQATALGRPMVIVPAGDDRTMWDRLSLDGIVVIEPRVDDPALSHIRSRRIPLVTIDRDPAHPDPWMVDSGVALGTRQILDHLWDQGGRAIALVSWDKNDAYRLDSEETYEEWAHERGIPVVIERWAYPRLGIAAEQVETLARRADIDGVYCLNELFALSILQVAQRLGRAVPESLLVAASQDFAESGPLQSTLTTLNFHPRQLGEAAVDLLTKRLRRAHTRRQVSIPATLDIRASTQRMTTSR